MKKEDLLTEISVDRTYLLRGLSQNGPRPPYESVYVGEAAQDEIARRQSPPRLFR